MSVVDEIKENTGKDQEENFEKQQEKTDEKKNNVEIEKEQTKREERKISLLKSIKITLILLLISNLYLCLNVYRENRHSFLDKSKHRVLIVSFVNESVEDVSDSRQISQGLDNGGHIRIADSNDGYHKAFSDKFEYYGATNYEGMYWSKGAVLNYIASEGWTLIQRESLSYNNDEYYYIK